MLSLVGQGLTMPAVLRFMGSSGEGAPRRLFETAREEFRAARAAVEELDYLVDAGVVPDRVEAALRSRYAPRLARAEVELRAAVDRLETSAGPLPDVATGAVGERAGRPATDAADKPMSHEGITREGMNDTVQRVERYLLDVERDRLANARRAGQLGAEAYDHLVMELDARRAALESDPA